MKVKHLTGLLTMFLLLLLAGCGGFQQPIAPSGIDALRKDQSVESVAAMRLGVPVHTYETGELVLNTVITVQIYPLVINSESHQFFALVYKNKKLYYWGYPDEFNKTDDPLLNQIGDRVCNSLKIDLGIEPEVRK